MSALFEEQNFDVVEEFVVRHEEDALERAMELIEQLEDSKPIKIDHSQFEVMRHVSDITK